MAAGRRRAVLGAFAGRVRASRRSFLLLPGVGQRAAYDEYVIQHRQLAAARAPELGFTIPRLGQPYPRSSLPAQQLALRVQAALPERLEPLEDALFHAAFTELADLADAQVLRTCAGRAGVPEAEVELALADDALASQAFREHQQALELGVQGIPALVLPGSEPITGAVPADVYRSALARALGD